MLISSTPASLRAAQPPEPVPGAVVFAWADGQALGAGGVQPGPEDGRRLLATLANILFPGATMPQALGMMDAAASIGVLGGGSAVLCITGIEPAAAGAGVGGPKIAVTRGDFVVSVPVEPAQLVRGVIEQQGTKPTAIPVRDPLTGAELRQFSVTLSSGVTVPPPPPSPEPSRVKVHRAALIADGSKGRACAEVYVDLNALRRAVPDAMDNTPLARVLGVWGLGNARDVMVTVRLVNAADVTTRDPLLVLPPGASPAEPYTGPAMVRVDVTWSARSEAPDKIAHGALAAGFFNVGKESLPAGARWVAAVRVDPAKLTVLALQTQAARLESTPRGVFARDVERWAGVQGAAMDRLAQSARGWLVLWPSLDPGAGAALDWRLVPGAALPMETFARDVGGVLTPFPAAAAADATGVRVVVVPGMTIGFAPVSAGRVLGRVEFDQSAADRVRAAVGEQVKGK